jgi:hypothetical protein
MHAEERYKVGQCETLTGKQFQFWRGDRGWLESTFVPDVSHIDVRVPSPVGAQSGLDSVCWHIAFFIRFRPKKAVRVQTRSALSTGGE